MVKEKQVEQRNLLINIVQDQKDTEVKGDKNNHMSQEYKPFALNFNNDKKVVSVTLPQQEAIFQLAEAFSKWLTENGIENVVTEQPILEPQSEDYGNPDALPVLEDK